LLRKKDGALGGFKWVGDNGAVLVVTEYIDEPVYRNDPNWVVNTLTLKSNQRLVGIKSGSRGHKRAMHYSFLWVICTEE
jgi:hypothetical protein